MSDQPTFDFVKRGAAASPIESTPATFALLVGIDRYADTTLREQRGCVNDVRQLQSFLMSTANVPAENVHVLTDEQATRAAIRTAWDRLEKAAAPGDQVWFHFSGHGSQLPSEDPDEVDGLDETLVPHDGRSSQILDKEVEAWVQRLAQSQHSAGERAAPGRLSRE